MRGLYGFEGLRLDGSDGRYGIEGPRGFVGGWAVAAEEDEEEDGSVYPSARRLGINLVMISRR